MRSGDPLPLARIPAFGQPLLEPPPLDRGDVRANAVFHVLLYTGCRVSDLVGMELADLRLAERTGSVVFRYGKGNKQRSVPLPLPARKALDSVNALMPVSEPLQAVA